MVATLKEEVLQMVASIEDESILFILKQDINELNHTAKTDWADELTKEEQLELRAELDADDTEENSVTQEEFDKIIQQWRLK